MKCLLNFAFALLITLHFIGQSNTVKGRVTDDNDTLFPGISILEKGTSKGASTDQNGDFKITVQPGAIVLITSVGLRQDIMNQKSLKHTIF